MKLALVLMFAQGELPYLRLHLPTTSESFDGIVAITDPKCTDGGLEFMRAIGADVIVEPWEYHWGDFATKLINYAEQLGYDMVCRVDPDEMLFPDAGCEIKRLLTEEASLLVLPRHEFFGDRQHVRMDLYPDGQARSFRLRRGIIIQGRRHEGIGFDQHDLRESTLDPDHRVMRPTDPRLHLHHYGWIGKTGIWRNQEKYQRHAQVEVGGPEHVALPPDTPLVSLPTVEFTNQQPLDPLKVGIYAPFQE